MYLSFIYHDGLNTNSYHYNERGWLTKSSSPLFEMQLKYNNGTVAQYNGNIADQLWGTPGSMTKSYAYSYDKLNRLSSGLSNGTTHEKNITYDPMGNIVSLTRDNGTAQSYSYTGNKLNSVSGGLSRSYTYDGNGNALATGTVNYTYNLLNLPSIANGIVYTYDAAGRKLRRVNGGTTTHYIDGIQYTGGTIDFVQTEVGVARKAGGSSFTYEYTLTDHLGNNRVDFDIYSSAARKIQADDYYPFGKRINTTPPFGAENLHLYNGKELQGGLGNATYDYGARFYDAEVGRWNAVDPLAEKFVSSTPYNYVDNNPITRIDPDGRDWYEFDEDGNYRKKVAMEGAHRIVIHTLQKLKGGSQYDSYKFVDFADPENDAKDIDNGVINKLVSVSDKQIRSMLTTQGAFESGRFKFASESQGGGDFDYSFSILRREYPDADFNPKTMKSNSLFLPEGEFTAHNFMNFGNYLWGATGYTVGFDYAGLQLGAHGNSLVNSAKNGYSAQWDSKDDQLSIKKGIYHAQMHNYRKLRK